MSTPANEFVQIAFTPTIAEHFRATGELRRVARVFDPVGALPYFLAVLLLSRLVTHAAYGVDPLRVEDLVFLAWPTFFLLGIGLAARNGLGRELRVELSAEGIEVRQSRRAWSMPWARVSRVEETAEFFLIAGERSAFYIPKRALGDIDAVAGLRAALAARGAAA